MLTRKEKRFVGLTVAVSLTLHLLAYLELPRLRGEWFARDFSWEKGEMKAGGVKKEDGKKEGLKDAEAKKEAERARVVDDREIEIGERGGKGTAISPLDSDETFKAMEGDQDQPALTMNPGEKVARSAEMGGTGGSQGDGGSGGAAGKAGAGAGGTGNPVGAEELQGGSYENPDAWAAGPGEAVDPGPLRAGKKVADVAGGDGEVMGLGRNSWGMPTTEAAEVGVGTAAVTQHSDEVAGATTQGVDEGVAMGRKASTAPVAKGEVAATGPVVKGKVTAATQQVYVNRDAPTTDRVVWVKDAPTTEEVVKGEEMATTLPVVKGKDLPTTEEVVKGMDGPTTGAFVKGAEVSSTEPVVKGKATTEEVAKSKETPTTDELVKVKDEATTRDLVKAGSMATTSPGVAERGSEGQMVAMGDGGKAGMAGSGKAGSETPAAKGEAGQPTDSEMDAFEAKPMDLKVYQNGRVEAGEGRKVKFVKPDIGDKGWLELLASGMPGIRAKLTWDATGRVVNVELSPPTGDHEIDLPIEDAAYRWWVEPDRDGAGRAHGGSGVITLWFVG